MAALHRADGVVRTITARNCCHEHSLAMYALVVAPALGEHAQQQRAGFLPVYCCGRQQLLRRGACTVDRQGSVLISCVLDETVQFAFRCFDVRHMYSVLVPVKSSGSPCSRAGVARHRILNSHCDSIPTMCKEPCQPHLIDRAFYIGLMPRAAAVPDSHPCPWEVRSHL
jgi:hypothetical protein